MQIATYLFTVILIVLIIYVIRIYNRLVMLKHNTKKSWGNIDVLLKQRHDELPKLVSTCKEYMKFEAETLEKVTAARSRVATAREAGNIGALGVAEGQLRAGLGQLFALVENYPELKANDNFQHLQGRISGLEDAIADRREFYNESVNINNIGIEEFPDVLIARIFNFGAFELLQFQQSELVDVDVGGLFNP